MVALTKGFGKMDLQQVKSYIKLLRILKMEQQYLNEFHMLNSQACLRDQKSCAHRPLSVEDVLAQSRRLGRSSIRVISKARGVSKNI